MDLPNLYMCHLRSPLKGKLSSSWVLITKLEKDQATMNNILLLVSSFLASESTNGTINFTDGAELLPCPFNQCKHGALPVKGLSEISSIPIDDFHILTIMAIYASN